MKLNMKQGVYYLEADAFSKIYLKLDPDLDRNPHFHDAIELLFFKEGEVLCCCEDQSEVLHPGDIFFCDSYETHYYDILSEHVLAYVLVVSREYTEIFRKLYGDLTFNNFLTNKEMNKKVFDVVDSWLKEGSNSQIANHAYINKILSLLINTYPMINRRSRNNDMLSKELLKYIHLHYLEDITIISIAHDLGYSPEYCSKILKNCLKTGIRDYINSLRINKANELMNDKSLNLSQLEILYQCGFSSPSTYYRVKKKFENN